MQDFQLFKHENSHVILFFITKSSTAVIIKEKGEELVNLLTIHNVTKQYGSLDAVKEVSISIPEGVCYGLVGPNGAGKSTLIKMISSIIRDYKGKIQFNEKQLSNTLKNKLGYVPQDIILEEDISAAGNLYLFGRIYGLKGNQLELRTQEVLELIGLRARGKDKVSTFSGGMKRKIGGATSRGGEQDRE